jgi:Golgi phosphoprotein 3 (GPP34)
LPNTEGVPDARDEIPAPDDTPTTLPHTLHGRLYLLAHDRRRRRLHRERLWLLGFCLRAAMLTDLYLTGYLRDVEGRAHLCGSARHSDPLLAEVLKMVEVNAPRAWAWLIATEQDNAPALVSHELTGRRWLRQQQYRKLGIFPAARLWLSDENLVADLAARVEAALGYAVAGRRSDPQLLALGPVRRTRRNADSIAGRGPCSTPSGCGR